jgi:hypothetical protein
MTHSNGCGAKPRRHSWLGIAGCLLFLVFAGAVAAIPSVREFSAQIDPPHRSGEFVFGDGPALFYVLIVLPGLFLLGSIVSLVALGLSLPGGRVRPLFPRLAVALHGGAFALLMLWVLIR